MSDSAIYEGWIAHRRLTPVPHSFRYRIFLPLLDLDELPDVLDPIPLWSARRPAPSAVSSGSGGSGAETIFYLIHRCAASGNMT